MALKQNLAAEIPLDLREADELLAKYGRWAKDRRRYERCGSAEGAYKAPPNDDDRQPKMPTLTLSDAMACQRALAGVPQAERIVLGVLYIPRKVPVEVQLRRLNALAASVICLDCACGGTDCDYVLTSTKAYGRMPPPEHSAQ